MKDFYEYSTCEVVALLGRRYREYRLRCSLTQSEVAAKAGVSLVTLQKFEAGAANNISLSTLILLLRIIGQVNAIDELLPELPESPYLLRGDKKIQRVRHK